jgi:hypothetical protein
MKVLIADPDRELADMLRDWFTTLSYEAYSSYTGERAKLE